jgi:cysteinyl-tRNA synthetase
MPIHIYNSLTRKKEEFIPLKDKYVKMYVCGPTVYDEPHIGHARSAYIFDVIRRYLVYKGYEVKFVRNVTDVDDKIINKARNDYKGENLDTAFKKVATQYLDSYHKALDDLGIPSGKPEIDEPKASEYIVKMIEFINDLINRGIAYQAGGDVYFDISKAKNYGKLSNQSLDKMEIGTRVTPGENKKDPLDFALWKSAKENEPSWDSPWGKGRPGWHIECSVMSSDILGDEFDIHGGGIDLIFPHHENEIAQSEGAGKKFARYWIHHGLLTINGQKMSKSLGNFITIEELLKKYNLDVLKMFFLHVHYSRPIDFSEKNMQESVQALERITILLNKISRILNPRWDDWEMDCETAEKSNFSWDNDEYDPSEDSIPEIEDIKREFLSKMDDDFNTPQALATIFNLVASANKRINDFDFIYMARKLLQELMPILGIKFSAEKNLISSNTIKELIGKRSEAKKKRDFKEADQIRKELEEKGIILEDTKDGTTWRRKI